MKYLAPRQQYPSLFASDRKLASPELLVTYPRVTCIEETLCGELPAIKLSLDRALRPEEEARLRKLMNGWRHEKRSFSADLRAGKKVISLHSIPRSPKPLDALRLIAFLVLREVINSRSDS